MNEITFILDWFFIFLLIGLIFLPISSVIFPTFTDKGYIFSKTLGIVVISYLTFILSISKIIPFNYAIVFSIFISLVLNYFVARKIKLKKIFTETKLIFIFEEILFLLGIIFLAFMRGNQPSINGLEKFMDFGFVNSILRSEYLPPKDIWFTPFTINYYYFGHLITAVLTRISSLPSSITYNLMLASLFSLCFVSSFSIGSTLINYITKNNKFKLLFGLISGFFVTLAGNIHPIYAFFMPYQNESPIPFWDLMFSPLTFPNSYWYPNATRFIYNTIHEFPIYSWVVADLHGHVLDIPIVLLTIAVIFSLFIREKFKLKFAIFIGFLLSIMYMTNAWDGVIYLLLSLVIFFILATKFNKKINVYLIDFIKSGFLVLISYFVFSFPFNLTFKPFVSGIGLLCAPDFLVSIGKFGPFLFEADHCQLSPPWQLMILYGFFYFMIFSYFFVLRRIKDIKKEDYFVLILIAVSTLLILLPELVYIKDIYPAHYRANTMFKLGYQAFIMLSLSSAYILIRIFSLLKKIKLNNTIILIWTIFVIILLTLISIYPFQAISSYYNNLQNFTTIDGTKYLEKSYPSDYKAINWINKNIKGQPVILEAQGDSYTDFARVSSNTGLQTVLGWTVHEWLWRGSYDVPAPRIEDVNTMYQSSDIGKVKSLLKKYNVSLVFVGNLERNKYRLNEDNFNEIGKTIYSNEDTKIYKINPL